MKFAWWCLVPCVVALSACPSTSGEGEGEGEGEPDVELDNPYGFAMRVPQDRTLPCPDCQGGGGDVATPDKDYLCTFTVDDHEAVVYLRATATSVDSQFFPVPVYDDVRAFIAENDVVTELNAAGYDTGGNHRNDFFFFTIGGVRYTFNHSSYGFGFRVCQPPDCVTREADGALVDGCQSERSLAEACIAVVDPLPPLVDNFERCVGDPNGDPS